MKDLENDTGLDNVSDYLFWPELIDGLGKNADAETKIRKILEDRKQFDCSAVIRTKHVSFRREKIWNTKKTIISR